jgi:hypothetical protein
VGNGVKLLSFLALASCGDEWLTPHPGRFTPGEGTPAPIKQKAGWAPQPVWTLIDQRQYRVPVGYRTTISRLSSL